MMVAREVSEMALVIDWGSVLMWVLVLLALVGSVVLVTATHKMRRRWRGRR